MQRKRLSLILAVALIGSLLGLVPGLAQAQTVNEVRSAGNLMPNDGFTDKNQLSDAFDGVDSLAHLTAIADPRADRVEFFACATAVTTGAGITSTNCRSIGTDSSGTQVVPPSGTNETFQAGSFEAYEFFWDIPADLNDDQVTIASRACNGAPSSDVQAADDPTQEGTPINCRDSFEVGIELDDASTTGTGTAPPLGTDGRELPTGEITGICTGTANDCLPVGAGAGTGAGTFTPFPHGSALPTTDFTLRYRTSPEVTGAGACIGGITGTPTDNNSKADPTTCTTSPTSTTKTDVNANGADNQTTFNEFSSRFAGVTAPANSTFANRDVAIFGSGGDDLGECGAAQFANTANASAGFTAADTCVLDEHYAVSFEQSNAGLVLTFNNDESATPAAGTTTCASPDTAETNRLGTTETVTACLSDQTGSRTNATITFESTGVGTLTCTGGTGTGQTATTPTTATAGDTQRCTVTTVNGRATASLTNGNTGTATPANSRTGTPGDQTVTACVDRTATTSNPTGCGTADTPTSNEVVKTWVTIPAEIAFVFAEEDGTADCGSGDQFKVNQVGDDDQLVACVTDVQGRSASTAGADSDGATGTQNNYRLTFGTGGCDSVGFTSNPPSETGADGQATVNIRAIAQGTCTITANLQTSTGTGAFATTDSASVTKSVEGTVGTEPQCNDGVDNDGDGDIDFPDDDGCVSIEDDTENSDGTDGGEGPPVERGPCQGFNENSRNNLPTGGSVIVGTEGNDILAGTNGDDIICGLGGNDIIDAGDGADTVVGNSGNDQIDGGGDKDTINGNQGDDTINGQNQNDVIKGSKGDDTIRGNSGFDTLRGGGGKDTLQGGKGADILRGGGGNDTLKGFTGNDVLNGGGGTDTCNPGPGRDKVRNCER